MEATIEMIGNAVVVVLPGTSLDASSAKAFKQEVNLILESHKQVVFDLSELHFVDSSGLGAILSCLRHLNARGGDLKLCSMSRPVRALFELVRMHRIFDIYNSKEEAAAAFES